MARLHRRLLVVLVAMTTGTVVLSGSATYLVLRSEIRRNLDESILELARTELASATDTGRVHVHEQGLNHLEISGLPGYEKFVWILDNSNRIVARTSNTRSTDRLNEAYPLVAEARQGHPTIGDIEVAGTRLRAVFYPFKDPTGTPSVGIVGVPSVVFSDVMTSTGQVILLTAFSSIALTFAIASLLARSLTDPLTRLARTAEEIDPLHPGAAEFIHAPYREINGVAQSINRLVSRAEEILSEREKTIRAQRQFLADVSHELRTPVSNLQGTIEVSLRRDRSAEEYRETLVGSLHEVGRMSRLVQDLLVLAKTDLGQFAIQLKPTDVSDVVRESAVAASYDLKDSLEFTLDIPETMPACADHDRLRQAVDNLLRNALTHANSKVRVAASKEQERIRISISNDGPPLGDDEATLIFERFYRADSSRARDTGGSGLGLPIVRLIAQGHGGDVQVRSEDGWTTFSIEFSMASPEI